MARAGFVLPDYGGRCLDAVLPAALGALGAPLPDVEERRADLDLPRAERVCVVLVDGLGHRLLAERAGHAPFLRRLLPDAHVLTSGYPSTTATSMGLFGASAPAGRTGLAGYTVRNPATRGLANLVSWTGAASPEVWQREPSWFSRAVTAGVGVTSVGPAKFAGSGLTEAALRGARYVRAETLADRVDVTARTLREPGLVYLYWGDVDKVGHHHGWRSPEWGDALGAVDAELGRLARLLPSGTLLLVTADHGMVDVDPSHMVDVAATPALARDVDLVAGETRAVQVYAVPGTADQVLDRWRTELGDRAVVVAGDEAVAAGWFGAVADHVRPIIGDVVVAARDAHGVVDSRTQTPHALALRGVHGSLTEAEMLVPLMVTAGEG